MTGAIGLRFGLESMITVVSAREARPLSLPNESNPESKEEAKSLDAAAIAAKIDSTHSFPHKLLELLQNEVDTEAICWLPDEESFRINKKLFEERILNRFFRGNKYTSITRNLNRWYVERTHLSPVLLLCASHSCSRSLSQGLSTHL